MSKKGIELTRKESDEWLCSSTYRPNRSEIVSKCESEERQPKKKKLKLAVVIPKSAPSKQQFVRFERVDNGVRRIESTSAGVSNWRPPNRMDPEFDVIEDDDDVFTSSFKKRNRLEAIGWKPAAIKIISPVLPKSVSIRRSADFSPPVLQSRQSPEQVFASLTPKRKRFLEVVKPDIKRRKEEEDSDKDPFESPEESANDESEHSDSSEVSNLFYNLSPIKQCQKAENNIEPHSPQKSQFSPNFITGYEAQFTAFEDSQLEMKNEKDGKSSPDLIENDPLSIYEESEQQEARDLDGSPFKIEISPEKKAPRFEENATKKPKKTLRFADPEDFEASEWRRDHFIEESCGLHLQNGEHREYAIDIETQGIMDESCALPDEHDAPTQKYLEAESCAVFPTTSAGSSKSVLSEDLYDRDELDGLSARFASLMASKSSERRLLMSDVVFGTVPRSRLVKLNLLGVKRYGLRGETTG